MIKNKESVKKYISWVIIIVIIYFAGFSSGQGKTRENFTLNLDSANITECDPNGCHISLPEVDSFYAICGEDYSCERIAKTEVQRKKDETTKKLLDKLLLDSLSTRP